MKQLKICYISNSMSPHTHKWIKYFADRGHKIELLYLKPPGSGRIQLLKEGLRIKKYIQKIKPDILHSHQVDIYGWLGAFINFHPFIISPWGGDILSEQKVFKTPFRRIVESMLASYALKKADVIAVHSNYLSKAVARLGFGKKTHLIKWGINLSRFTSGLDASFLRKKLSLGDSPVVLSLRRFAPLYNIDTLIRAIPLVLQKIPEVKFILKDTGDAVPAYKESLKLLIEKLGVSEAIRFAGECSYNEIPLYFNLADIFVSIPSSDGMPLSVQEGMASGAIPVISDLEALKELITDGENGLVVPIGDEEALAKAIIYLLSNPELREKIKVKNRLLIEKSYDQNKEMARMERLYEKLAGANR